MQHQIPNRPDIGQFWENMFRPGLICCSSFCISVMMRSGVCCPAHNFSGDLFTPPSIHQSNRRSNGANCKGRRPGL